MRRWTCWTLAGFGLALAACKAEVTPVDGFVFNEIEPTVDYVEFFNDGSSPIDLSGYKLTDDGPDKGPRLDEALVFPEGTKIKRGEFLLVIANLDEKALPGLRTECVVETPSKTCFHARWGISRSKGESMYVLAPDNSVLISMTYPPHPVGKGFSWGRLPDGLGGFGVTRPSPGRPNLSPWKEGRPPPSATEIQAEEAAATKAADEAAAEAKATAEAAAVKAAAEEAADEAAADEAEEEEPVGAAESVPAADAPAPPTGAGAPAEPAAPSGEPSAPAS